MSGQNRLTFNPPPGWPRPPDGWTPPKGWTPDPSWPEMPPGWQLWIAAGVGTDSGPSDTCPNARPTVTQPPHDSERVAPGADARIAFLEAENAALRARLETSGTDADEVVILDDERVLQEVGIYRYHHPLENALAYKSRLDELATRITELVKTGNAIEKSNMFTFNGSLAMGRKMTRDLATLMLRAFNAEADNTVRTLRAGNVVTAKRRLEASRTAIARLGRMMEMRISDAFFALRIEEIELTADYLMKKQEEREAAREERERLQEERKVAQELAAERERLEKERHHLVTGECQVLDLFDAEIYGPGWSRERRASSIDMSIH